MSSSNQSQNNKVIFKCDGIAGIISQKQKSFYENNEFFDAVLIAGSDSVMIQGHRIVLSALSEYFLAVFRGGQTASKNNVVELKELDAPTLKLVIDFMYSGWIELSLENVENILKTVAFLKIKTLIDGCRDFMETHMTSRNCLKYFRLAKELNLFGLKKKSSKCTYTHFEEVSKEKELVLLNEEELKDLLFNENPYNDFEEHVFLAMVAWVKYDKINREALTFQLLSMLRYQYLTPKFIVENRKSVCKTVESYELICSWLQWHLSPETRSVDQQICELEPRNGKLTAITCLDSYKVSVQTYNPKADSWTTDKEILFPKKKINASMIVIDKKLIVVGGKINGTLTNSVECLDLRTFKWTDLPPMQEARYRSKLANLNGSLCVYGGYDKNHDSLNSFVIYNFSTRQWNSLEVPSTPSNFGRIIAHNGILHIVDFYSGCMQSYDAISNQWISKELVKKKLKYFGLAAIDRYFYVIGGECEDKTLNTVSRYDLSNDTWRELAPLSHAQLVPKTLVVGKKILICREFPYNIAKLVEEYNPETDTWTTLSPLKSEIQSSIGPVCLFNSHIEF